jgi:hypothetical protein
MIGIDDCFASENCARPGFRVGDSRSALNSFRYLKDRLFLVACSLYAINRWEIKPRVHNAFLRGQFNDLLLIPCALPPLLLAQRWLKLRPTAQPPAVSEIASGHPAA